MCECAVRAVKKGRVGGVNFSPRGCVRRRSGCVLRQIGGCSGLCLRFKKGLVNSGRTGHMLPNFSRSTGVGLLRGLGSRTRVLVYMCTKSVRHGGVHNSCNVACSVSIFHLVSRLESCKLSIGDIIVAHCGKRPTAGIFVGGLRGHSVGICARNTVRNCPSGVRGVIDRRNFNRGACVPAAGPVIIIATPNPNDNGLTAYLGRLCRRHHRKHITNCSGFRAFPI